MIDNYTKGIHVDTRVHLNPGAGISDEKYRGSTSPIHLHRSIYGCVVQDIIFPSTCIMYNL